jgi:hypothetical protein
MPLHVRPLSTDSRTGCKSASSKPAVSTAMGAGREVALWGGWASRNRSIGRVCRLCPQLRVYCCIAVSEVMGHEPPPALQKTSKELRSKAGRAPFPWEAALPSLLPGWSPWTCEFSELFRTTHYNGCAVCGRGRADRYACARFDDDHSQR